MSFSCSSHVEVLKSFGTFFATLRNGIYMRYIVGAACRFVGFLSAELLYMCNL